MIEDLRERMQSFRICNISSGGCIRLYRRRHRVQLRQLLLTVMRVLRAHDRFVERRDLFWKAVVYYREQLWDEALSLFHGARGSSGSDGPVEFYIRRIEQLRSGLPALDWSSARL